MVQKQICEYEDIMSPFRTSTRENSIAEPRITESINRTLADNLNTTSSTPIPIIQVRRTGLLNDMDEKNISDTTHNHKKRTGLLNDLSNSCGKITHRRRSGGPYERKGVEASRSKSLAPSKIQSTVKRIIAFKLKCERPHNILSLILMDRSTKQVLSFDELSFDELNDVKRCVNDPKIFPKIQDQLKKANVAETTRNILKTLFRNDIF